MTFFDFQQLNSEDSIKERIEKIKINTLQGNGKYQFVEDINEVLNYFKGNRRQLKIITEKIKQQRSAEALVDVIAELLVAHEHLNNNVRFIKERKNKTPDIKTDKYLIEVKRIRLSDSQIELLDEVASKKGEIMSSGSEIGNSINNDKSEALNKKIKEKIDKAIGQIGNKEGIIYIVFSLDPLGHRKSMHSRKEDVERFCFDYLNSKQIKNIKLFTRYLDGMMQYKIN